MTPLYVQGLKGTEYFYTEWNRVETEGSEILKKKKKKPAGTQQPNKDTSNLLEKVARTGSFIICCCLHQGGDLKLLLLGF